MATTIHRSRQGVARFGAEVLQGDDDDASLSRALVDVHALLLAGRDGPDTVRQQLDVIQHAQRGNIRHIVKLSAIWARTQSPIELMRDYDQVDACLRAGNTPWTLLRPHLYMQNLLRAAKVIQAES